MNIETIGIIIAALATIGGINAAVTKWIIKQVSIIARDEINKSQNSCDEGRKRQMATVIERIERLEKSDNDTQLTIVAIKKDLENLTAHHETTQSMIQRLEDHQQDTFSQLIKTIQSFTIKND